MSLEKEPPENGYTVTYGTNSVCRNQTQQLVNCKWKLLRRKAQDLDVIILFDFLGRPRSSHLYWNRHFLNQNDIVQGALQPAPLIEKILVCSCKLCYMTEAKIQSVKLMHFSQILFFVFFNKHVLSRNASIDREVQARQ